MGDVDDTVDRLNSLYSRTNVRVPHCDKCGEPLTRSDFGLEEVTLYSCGNTSCIWYNLYVCNYTLKERGS